MPTIELHGYSTEEQIDLIAKIIVETGHLEYSDDIVLVTPTDERVLTTDGTPRPFLRILTRSWMRAHELRKLLAHAADTELLIIDFYPRIPQE